MAEVNVKAIFDGQRVRDVAFFGQTADVWIRPRRSEINRRRELGVSAITDRSSLRALMELPAGIPVPVACLGETTVAELGVLAEMRAIELLDRNVNRLAVPAVEILGFAKLTRSWPDVEGITLLDTHGPRYVLVPPRLVRRVLREACPEVGIAVSDGPQWHEIRPARASAVRPSWQRWAIAEAAFDRWQRVSR